MGFNWGLMKFNEFHLNRIKSPSFAQLGPTGFVQILQLISAAKNPGECWKPGSRHQAIRPLGEILGNKDRVGILMPKSHVGGLSAHVEKQLNHVEPPSRAA